MQLFNYVLEQILRKFCSAETSVVDILYNLLEIFYANINKYMLISLVGELRSLMLQRRTQHKQINTLERETLVLNDGSPNATLLPSLSQKERAQWKQRLVWVSHRELLSFWMAVPLRGTHPEWGDGTGNSWPRNDKDRWSVDTWQRAVADWGERPFHSEAWGLPWRLRGKEPACQCTRRGFKPWSGGMPRAQGNHHSRCALEPLLPNKKSHHEKSVNRNWTVALLPETEEKAQHSQNK